MSKTMEIEVNKIFLTSASLALFILLQSIFQLSYKKRGLFKNLFLLVFSDLRTLLWRLLMIKDSIKQDFSLSLLHDMMYIYLSQPEHHLL